MKSMIRKIILGRIKSVLLTLFVLFFGGILRVGAISPFEFANSSPFPDDSMFPTAPEDEEDPYFILCGEADKAIADKDYVTAVLRLRDALRVSNSNPTVPMVYSNLGYVYACLDQDSLALNAYNDALRMAPAMTVVRENRAMLLLKMGRDGEAFNEFANVIERDSLRAGARYYHGLMSLYGGELDAAKADFAVLESVAPDAYNTNVAMSSLYSLTGEWRKAVPYYEKLIAEDPAPEYYSALAGCYLDLDELSKASETIAEGLKTCGDDPELYYYRALLNKKSFLLDDAKADAKRAVRLGADPNKVNALFN